MTGLAWFKLTFGCFFLVIALAFVARFFQVRNVFEIKARYRWRHANMINVVGFALRRRPALGSIA